MNEEEEDPPYLGPYFARQSQSCFICDEFLYCKAWNGFLYIYNGSLKWLRFHED